MAEAEKPKNYDPGEEEPKWQRFWEENKLFAFDPNDTKREIYSIDTPPPTVSGKMHMGHAFSYSHFDFVARFKRMQGFNVLMPIGTDDNGLPTQTLIQKIKKIRAQDMDRKEFVNLCLKVLEKELRPEYLEDFRKLGMSYNWDVNYSTIDPHCRRVSQKSFLELYEMGRAYRQEAAAIWCPKCQTAIAQVELEDQEQDSVFNDIVFKVDDQELVIATTRPELLPACVGVFFHPDDKRYQKLEGKMAIAPLFNFEVPILPDERANPEKGTGIVMCCTFGDQTDIEWQKAHNLPIKTGINKDGTMSSLAGKYAGMKISDARKQIIDDLKDAGLLRGQTPIRHMVNTHERCGTPVEFVHSKQWFIKYLDLKDKMLRWGEELNWFPQHMKNRYDNWVKGLQWDWCISRQIFFGIPFPVWYCDDCGHVILARIEDLPVDPMDDKPPVKECPACKSRNMTGEKDVQCTWATSSLTPTIAIELFKNKPIYAKLRSRPMNLRPQAHDIISFWLFNTVFKSNTHFNIQPWNDCMISGWILDPKGKKMSKSKGNIIEPREMIKKYSADALRFMAGSVKLGDDISFPEKELIAGKKFVTKLWNASKFADMHLQDHDRTATEAKIELEMFDRWILAKLNKVIDESTKSLEKYEYSKTKSETENFFWNTFCDFYLEIVKARLYNPETYGVEKRKSAQHALYKTLLTVLKLMAPITPHITEAIYQSYFIGTEKAKSIHVSPWPKVDSDLAILDEEAERIGDLGIDIITAVRKFKSENAVSLKKSINLSIGCSEEDKKRIEQIQDDLKATVAAESLGFGGENDIVTDKFGIKLAISIAEEK